MVCGFAGLQLHFLYQFGTSDPCSLNGYDCTATLICYGGSSFVRVFFTVVSYNQSLLSFAMGTLQKFSSPFHNSVQLSQYMFIYSNMCLILQISSLIFIQKNFLSFHLKSVILEPSDKVIHIIIIIASTQYIKYSSSQNGRKYQGVKFIMKICVCDFIKWLKILGSKIHNENLCL